MKERTMFFHTKTGQYLKPWLEERSKDCRHDYLFHNEWGRPASSDMLRRQFNDLFCDPKQEKRFEKWSTHRLRHTMATTLANAGGKVATISAVGGWSNLTTMLGYIDADENVARAGYLEAVRISEKKKEEPSASEFSMPSAYHVVHIAHDGKTVTPCLMHGCSPTNFEQRNIPVENLILAELNGGHKGLAADKPITLETVGQ
jgi:hypothetical protein